MSKLMIRREEQSTASVAHGDTAVLVGNTGLDKVPLRVSIVFASPRVCQSATSGSSAFRPFGERLSRHSEDSESRLSVTVIAQPSCDGRSWATWSHSFVRERDEAS